MKEFSIFLTFNGQCRQALKYYQKCFGGQLTLQRMGEMPNGNSMSKVMQNVVVSAVLANNYFKLVGTDLTGDTGIIIGNNISILINCASNSERDRIRDFLSDSKNEHRTSGNNLINVTDKYKVNWILSIK